MVIEGGDKCWSRRIFPPSFKNKTACRHDKQMKTKRMEFSVIALMLLKRKSLMARVASAAHRPLLLGGDIGRERGLLNPAIQGLDIRVKGSVGDTLKERPIAGKEKIMTDNGTAIVTNARMTIIARLDAGVLVRHEVL